MSILHSSDLAALIRKYDRPGPRYTSYPTALEFNEGVGPRDYLQRLAKANEQADEHGDIPWAVYVHLPFCESRCSFCGCNVIILHDHRHSAPYLADLRAEFALIASKAPRRRRVSQFHLGGGTPNFQTPEEIEEIVRSFFDYFEVAPGAELACEIDPRTTRPEHLEKLRALGFNRVSMGVQDFTPRSSGDRPPGPDRGANARGLSPLPPARVPIHQYGFDLWPP